VDDTYEEEDDTYQMVWTAGIHLTQYFTPPSARVLLANKGRCLELGSGMDVTGMGITAALVRDGLSSDHMALMDFPMTMPLLRANYERNKDDFFPG